MNKQPPLLPPVSFRRYTIELIDFIFLCYTAKDQSDDILFFSLVYRCNPNQKLVSHSLSILPRDNLEKEKNITVVHFFSLLSYAAGFMTLSMRPYWTKKDK